MQQPTLNNRAVGRQSFTACIVLALSCSNAPKSSFKALFVGTPIKKAPENLKMNKAVPEGLKPQECERGSSQVRPPIPYIPEKDDLKEAMESNASI